MSVWKCTTSAPDAKREKPTITCFYLAFGRVWTYVAFIYIRYWEYIITPTLPYADFPPCSHSVMSNNHPIGTHRWVFKGFPRGNSGNMLHMKLYQGGIRGNLGVWGNPPPSKKYNYKTRVLGRTLNFKIAWCRYLCCLEGGGGEGIGQVHILFQNVIILFMSNGTKINVGLFCQKLLQEKILLFSSSLCIRVYAYGCCQTYSFAIVLGALFIFVLWCYTHAVAWPLNIPLLNSTTFSTPKAIRMHTCKIM